MGLGDVRSADVKVFWETHFLLLFRKWASEKGSYLGICHFIRHVCVCVICSFCLLVPLFSSLTVPFNLVHSRVPGSTTSISSPLPPPLASAPNPEASPHSWVAAAGDCGRLSSDEGDAETPEDTDRPTFHCSNRHPQPLGVNTFATALTARTDVFIVRNVLLFSPWRAYFNMPFRGVICVQT